MKYLIKGDQGKELVQNTTPQCSACFSALTHGSMPKIKCPMDGKNRRLGATTSKIGQTHLCSYIEADLNSSRVFRARLDAYSTIAPAVQEIKADLETEYNKQLDRVTHNLTSLNAHCIQELFALVPQETLTKNITQQMKFVLDVMKASPQEAAKTFLRIAKNNLAMKLEFVAMRFLEESAPHPKLREHNIRSVVLNILHTFFQDFNEHDVRVLVDDFNSTVMLDYDTFSVALYHIIDNATKYIMPHSTLHVRFLKESNRVVVRFEMMSLPIPETEIDRIGEEKFSGEMATYLQLAGHGMGMFRTKRLLVANDAQLIIRANIDPAKKANHNGIAYELNHFSASLTKGAIS